MFRELLSKRNLISISLGLFTVAAVTCVLGSRTVLAATPAANEDGQTRNVYYTTSSSTPGEELWAIEVTGTKITTSDIGPINAGGCASLAMSPSRTMFSMCGDLFGNQELATIDTKTGLGTLFGVPVPGLAIMAMAFGPNGILYAVGDCNPNGANFECGPGPAADPNYNSLYTVNVVTGAVTRVGSTGAPQFFMDLAFDRHGNLYGVTTTLSPSTVPAILYRIDPATGTATKIVSLVGSTYVMGLAFASDGKLYATDYVNNPGLYLIDPKTGFESAVAALPFGLSSGLELEDPLP
jgi:DNA-binding beta-propeller fold protein YncE